MSLVAAVLFSHNAIYRERDASKDKELFVVEGATHVDLYGVRRYVEPAVAKLAAFFSGKL